MISRKLEKLNSLVKIERCLCSKSKSESLKLKNQRFVYPVQTRLSDHDENGCINDDVYNICAGTLMSKYASRYVNLKALLPYVAKVDTFHHHHLLRKRVSYPSILICGINVVKVGNSSAVFNSTFFQPKSEFNAHDLRNLNISLKATMVDSFNLSKMAKYYCNKASTSVCLTIVFVDSNTKRSVIELPDDLKNALNKIMFPSHLMSGCNKDLYDN